mmetsp:Transcript_42237/g.88246  ORF Transcript_42237/g.88246 Transcript_42237/m.88246 type:complete len:92 (+) Transcript_42237:429-704(+)
MNCEAFYICSVDLHKASPKKLLDSSMLRIHEMSAASTAGSAWHNAATPVSVCQSVVLGVMSPIFTFITTSVKDERLRTASSPGIAVMRCSS